MPRLFPRSLRFIILICAIGSLFFLFATPGRKTRTPPSRTFPEDDDDTSALEDPIELPGRTRDHDQGVFRTDHDERNMEYEPMVLRKPKHRFGLHTYRPDGLVEVNPEGRHPIYDLVDRAQSRWNEKVQKQSKTLAQAVREYRRRYHRPPPKGFDKWWAYVQLHDVQLPDEYDQIYRDIEPFWGIKPEDLKNFQESAEAQRDTYTIRCCDNGEIVMTGDIDSDEEGAIRIGMERADEQRRMLKPIEQFLPEFRATFTIHDGPKQFVGHDLRWQAIDAASVNEFIDIDKTPDLRRLGWASGCPSSSPLRRVADPYAKPSIEALHAARPKTFIHDHLASMNPCDHKSHAWLNGHLANYGIGPAPQSVLHPTFSISVTPLHSDILAVASENWTEDVGDDPEWDDKKDERMLWRGTNTGLLLQESTPWLLSQRIRMVMQSDQTEGEYAVLKPLPANMKVEATNISAAILGDALMDTMFAGGPVQCFDGLCEKMEEMFNFSGRMSFSEANEYKYVMDIDGNGWSARFKRLMTTNSLVLKSTIFPEWFTDRVMPWVHYVPIKMDLTDLYDVLVFFRGDPSKDGEGGHDEMAKKIAMAGKDWSQKFWRQEDMTAYMFRLMLEYGRVMNPNREQMSYVP